MKRQLAHSFWGIVTLLLVFLLFAKDNSLQAQTKQRCFTETNFCIAGRIREFWEQNGGIAVFGLPISVQQAEIIEGKSIQVQWFERNRLELHPEKKQPFDLLLGRLGAAALTKAGRDWVTFPKSEQKADCLFFKETGQQICGEILAAWRAKGIELDGKKGKTIEENLALFGLPLSEPQKETLNGKEYIVQWFERVRFEIHPENPSPYKLLLGLLGNELNDKTATNPTPTTNSHFDSAPCPFAPSGLPIECGYLTVPEDRANPAGPTIQLAVAIVRNNNPAPDPVIYLSGGPGSAALPEIVSMAQSYGSFLGNRELIAFDQRGTGASKPFLGCPESFAQTQNAMGQFLTREEKVQEEVEAMLRCRERLVKEGVNFAAYNSAASAADINDLRIQLGYNQVNLFGISYGTRLALTAIRDFPATIRTAILDSVYPPQVNLFTEMPANANRAFTTLFEGCKANLHCNANYPDLENTFYQVVVELNAHPITLNTVNSSGKRVSIIVDGNEFIHELFRLLYTTRLISELPAMIHDTKQGDYALLTQMERRRLTVGTNFSYGMYFAVECSEEIPFTTLEEVKQTRESYPKLDTFFQGILENTPKIFELCAALGVKKPAVIENEPVVGNVPTLLFSGEYDPITPPKWGELVGGTIQPSYFYQFPGTGHATITRGSCPYTIIRQFLNDPNSFPDASCLNTMGGPDF